MQKAFAKAVGSFEGIAGLPIPKMLLHLTGRVKVTVRERLGLGLGLGLGLESTINSSNNELIN